MILVICKYCKCPNLEFSKSPGILAYCPKCNKNLELYEIEFAYSDIKIVKENPNGHKNKSILE